MKILLRNLTIIGFIFLLASCRFNDNDTKKDPIQPEETFLNAEDKQEVFDEMKEASSEVDIYVVNMKLNFEELVGENKTVSRSELEGIIEESTISLDLTTTDTAGAFTNILHVYKLDSKVYVKNNDEPWSETVEQNNEFSNDGTFYDKIIGALDKTTDVVELVEIGDVYEIRYTGNDAVVFDAFESPFSLRLSGIDIEKETKINVLAVIDKETLYLQDLHFKITAEKDEKNIKMFVDVNYKDINEVTIEIPQEVIDEAVFFK